MNIPSEVKTAKFLTADRAKFDALAVMRGAEDAKAWLSNEEPGRYAVAAVAVQFGFGLHSRVSIIDELRLEEHVGSYGHSVETYIGCDAYWASFRSVCKEALAAIGT